MRIATTTTMATAVPLTSSSKRLMAALLCSHLERLRPHVAGWNAERRQRGTDRLGVAGGAADKHTRPGQIRAQPGEACGRQVIFRVVTPPGQEVHRAAPLGRDPFEFAPGDDGC